LFAGNETDRRDAPYLLEENSDPARQHGRSPFGLRWDDQMLAARKIEAIEKHIAQKTLPRPHAHNLSIAKANVLGVLSRHTKRRFEPPHKAAF
jgi:hypothetical protein